MRFNIKWLSELLAQPFTASELAQDFTQLGLEVEAIEGPCLDIAIPPNRGDCLGLFGLAREIAALKQLEWQPPAAAPPAAVQMAPPQLGEFDPKFCQVFRAQYLRGIDANVATPEWILARLTDAGIGAVSVVVDITNYVMLETGQPVHAYDAATLSGALGVASGRAGEQLGLLNQQTIRLSPQLPVVTDASGPQALAGVMGGQASAVTDATRDLCLECAYFNPVPIRLAARATGVATDASYRFERGVAKRQQAEVLARLVSLLQQVVGGTASRPALWQQGVPSQLPTVALRQSRITSVLGIAPPPASVAGFLTRLGFEVSSVEGGWQVQVPAHRHDIEREVDLIEEVARMVGLAAIPQVSLAGNLAPAPMDATTAQHAMSRQFLVARGFHEAITYSFGEAAWLSNLYPDIDLLQLANPISTDLAMMRPSLLPGLLQAVQYNQHRQVSRLKLFELGMCFVPTQAELKQRYHLAAVHFGEHAPLGWAMSKRAVDFYDIKAELEGLLQQLGFVATWRPATDPLLHPGQTADILIDGTVVGKLGSIHPSILQQLELPAAVVGFELWLEALPQARQLGFQALSKYPSIQRDIALMVAQQANFAQLKHTIEQAAGNWLQAVEVFDVYQGKGVPAGQKSLAIRLILQDPSRTLKDDEVELRMQEVITALQTTCGAILRE